MKYAKKRGIRGCFYCISKCTRSGVVLGKKANLGNFVTPKASQAVLRSFCLSSANLEMKCVRVWEIPARLACVKLCVVAVVKLKSRKRGLYVANAVVEQQ